MSSFRYAHLADLHLGSWRDPLMRELSSKAFLQAMGTCIQQEVDFILFAGDIFNTALPAIDTLKIVTKKLKELKEKDIPLYVIAGSHDFSPSGKTMIDVLEHAGLLYNVCKGTIDENTKKLHLRFTLDLKTGAKITGILGRKGQLDKNYYEDLALEPLEREQGYKIFMFHTSISELKPKHLQQIESQPASFLPKGFNYYAGGHIHHRTQVEIPEYGMLTYPGALFPNNFAEIEKYSQGGFYMIRNQTENQTENQTQDYNIDNSVDCGNFKHRIVVLENSGKYDPITRIIYKAQGHGQIVEWFPVKVIEHKKLQLDCSNKSPEVVTFEILNSFHQHDLQNTLVTLRLFGTLMQGKISDLNWKEIFCHLQKQGAAIILKNTAELHTENFEEVKISENSPELIEESIIREHLQQVSFLPRDKEQELAISLLHALNTTKKEGETTTDFQQRICKEAQQLLSNCS